MIGPSLVHLVQLDRTEQIITHLTVRFVVMLRCAASGLTAERAGALRVFLFLATGEDRSTRGELTQATPVLIQWTH